MATGTYSIVFLQSRPLSESVDVRWGKSRTVPAVNLFGPAQWCGGEEVENAGPDEQNKKNRRHHTCTEGQTISPLQFPATKRMYCRTREGRKREGGVIGMEEGQREGYLFSLQRCRLKRSHTPDRPTNRPTERRELELRNSPVPIGSFRRLPRSESDQECWKKGAAEW